MKARVARHASLILVGAILLVIVPISNAWALDSISSVSPNMLAPGATADLTMHGSFLLTPTFTFNPPTGITLNSTTQSGSDYIVNVTIAANAPTGPRDVIVTDLSGSSTCTKCFTVTPPPTISSISPTALASGGGPITFTITGTGFRSGAAVQVSGVGVTGGTPTISATSISIDLTAASTAVQGKRNVTVTNDDGQAATCSLCLTIDSPPKATAFSPAQRAGGLSNQVINIGGSGFTPGTNISFSGSGITLKSLSRLSSTNLQATIDTAPGATLGTRDVTFTNSDNGGHSICSACFSITGPTSASIAFPSTVDGFIVATFTQPVSGVSSSNTFVKLTNHTTSLPASITCANADGFPTLCSIGAVKTAYLLPASHLTPGQYYTVTVAATGAPAITDFGGLVVPQATNDYRTSLLAQQGEGAATSSFWATARTANALGGSYTIDHLPGASASYRFRGSSIVWYTNIGPSYGLSDLYVDGVLRATVNSYSSVTHYRAAFTVSGLTSADHTLTIRVRGKKGSTHGTGTSVAIDAFKTGRTLVSSPLLTYTWGPVKTAAAFGGAYIQSNLAGSSSTFTFRGTAIEWDTVVGPSMGRAQVFIDGVLKGTVDNYSAAYHYGAARKYAGLTDAVHTIKILVLGTHASSATGSIIAIDRWIVT